MSDIQTLKADYLTAVSECLPRLKSLAVSIRQAESQLTGVTDEKLQEEIDKFWSISGDRQTDYQLCQLAANLDALEEFWITHPDNKEQTPAETAIANELTPKPSKFNYKLWDHQAFGLSQSLWQIESIVGLAVRAVDHDSELGDELHGGLMAIAEICTRAQTTLEMDLMRPIEKQFKAD